MDFVAQQKRMVIEAHTKNRMAVGLWIGPFKIRDYLWHVVRDRESRPPDFPGLYLLSQHRWQHLPDGEAGVLYVGQAKYLRYRVGQFLADLLGFTGDDAARAATKRVEILHAANLQST